jgi:hypothetical protein
MNQQPNNDLGYEIPYSEHYRITWDEVGSKQVGGVLPSIEMALSLYENLTRKSSASNIKIVPCNRAGRYKE